jgi:hypothetical protein
MEDIRSRIQELCQARTGTRTELAEQIRISYQKEWHEIQQFLHETLYNNSLLYGGQTNDLGIVEDPVTLEEVLEEESIVYSEDGRKWCFSIDSLYECVQNGINVNPLTRKLLPQIVLDQLQEYRQSDSFFNVEVSYMKGFHVDKEKSIFSFHKGTRFIEILFQILTKHPICQGNSTSVPVLRKAFFLIQKCTYERLYFSLLLKQRPTIGD